MCHISSQFPVVSSQLAASRRLLPSVPNHFFFAGDFFAVAFFVAFFLAAFGVADFISDSGPAFFNLCSFFVRSGALKD
jgi:hypothetical protein